MAIRLGTTNIKNIYLGTVEVLAVYLGNNIVYKSITKYVSDYSARVIADGGTVESLTNLTTAAQSLRNNDLFEKCSFAIIPSGIKLNKIYTFLPENGLGDLVFSRNTTATRINISGNTVLEASNIARLNYPITGAVPQLLLEPQRTNLLLNSANISNQSISSVVSPFALSFTGSGTVTLSGSFVGSLSGTGVNNRVSLVFTPASGTLNINVSGSCLNGQIEVGSYPTSYIPTLSAFVTRNTDIITKNNIFTNGFITNNGGTFFLDLENNISTTRDIPTQGINLSDSSTQFVGNAFEVRNFGNGRLSIIKRVANSLLVLYSTNTLKVKIAIAWDGVNANVFVNGVKVVSNTSFNTTALEFLTLGGGDVAKNVVEGLLYDLPLSDSNCITLTTI